MIEPKRHTADLEAFCAICNKSSTDDTDDRIFVAYNGLCLCSDCIKECKEIIDNDN